MKKSLKLALSLVLVFSSATFAQTVPSGQDVTLDGTKIELEGYNIDGNNYFKLRDIAAVLADSDVSFDVDYNKDKNSVEINRNKNYEKLPTDLVKSNTNKEIKSNKSYQKVYIDNELVLYDAYFINDNNYFKIRDLGKTIGFYVDFDEKSNTIVVKSEKTDPTDLIERETIEFSGFATATSGQNEKIKFSEMKNLTAEDFTKRLTSIVLSSNDNRQFSAKLEYDNASNIFTLKPVEFKYKGELRFKPYIKVEQNENKEFFDFSNNININEILKDFSKEENLQVTLGYYLGDTQANNFRSISTIEFTK